ncbi:MAG: GNAT family N-acetyltransferase [OM182 bacterium MED-G24]|uniref:GNAT family N-acetyltransferase n=1 Tax=OM182 bacterium MED-G24 TaxID=1986255 RepID=A0A2A5WXN4_9GAMM|nr:MAG: GNAT family N-acetyltransferase [OM182 bacterium MED-G24]|tara:strand:+ start:6771 stop:7262 length:492 start_codon:yes stop_codon:yes gene_type:complete
MLDIRVASEQQRPIPERTLHLYLHDLSEFTGEEAGPKVRFDYDLLIRYKREDGRYPRLFFSGEIPCEFALIRSMSSDDQAKHVYQMAEFFVMRAYRRTGIGERAACLLFDAFPGELCVAQEKENTGATTFWRRVIEYYTGGRFEEGRSGPPEGPTQIFRSPSV